MDTENIVISILTIIISLIASKYVLPIMPEPKRARELLVKFMLLFFRYIFNLGVIAWTFYYDDLDKHFVFRILFFSLILVINYTNDMREKAENNVYKQLDEMFKYMSKKLNKTIENIDK